jgi:hypothetical protein
MVRLHLLLVLVLLRPRRHLRLLYFINSGLERRESIDSQLRSCENAKLRPTVFGSVKACRKN